MRFEGDPPPKGEVLLYKARGITESGEAWSDRTNQRIQALTVRAAAIKARASRLADTQPKEPTMSQTPISEAITKHYSALASGQDPDAETVAETVGELVTKAIDARARAWHLDGVDVNVPLVKLRHRIREAMPALKALERSREPVAVAKSRVAKAADRELSAAFDFVTEWT